MGRVAVCTLGERSAISVTEKYKVHYSIESSSRPMTCIFDDEQKAILFSAKHSGSVIRRDSDNALLDMVSGQWIKIGTSQDT